MAGRGAAQTVAALAAAAAIGTAGAAPAAEVKVADRAQAWRAVLAALAAEQVPVKLADEAGGLILAEKVDRYSAAGDRFSAAGMKARGKVRDWAACPSAAHYIATGATTVLNITVRDEAGGPTVRVAGTFTEQRTRGQGLRLVFEDGACETTGALEGRILAAAAAGAGS